MADHVAKHSRKPAKRQRHPGRIVAIVVLAIVVVVAGALFATGTIPLPGKATEKTVQSEPAANAGPNDDSSAKEATSEEDASAQNTEEQKAQEQAAQDDGLATTVRATSDKISCEGTPQGFEQSEGYAKLTQAIGGFEDKGYTVGIYLQDLSTGATLTYRPDVEYYPASSMKAPYVVAVYQELVDTGKVSASSIQSLTNSIILASDNDAFHTLNARLGRSCMTSWFNRFGFNSTGYGGQWPYTTYFYPPTTSRQLAQMWGQINTYLSSGQGSAPYLADLFSRRERSALAQGVGSRHSSWGKAGWYPSTGHMGAKPAMVDAGVVFTDSGNYLVVAMSDAPCDFDSLATVFTGLDDAYDSMVNK